MYALFLNTRVDSNFYILILNIMGWFVTLCFVTTGVAAVAAIGFVGYVMYKSLNAQKTGYKKRHSGSSNVPAKQLITFDDLKARTETELRHRNINSAEENNDIVNIKTVPNPPSKTCQATQMVDAPQTTNNNHQGTEVAGLSLNCNNLSNAVETQTDSLSIDRNDQNSQTTDSLLNIDPSHGNNFNIREHENNVDDGTESVFSDASVSTVSSVSSNTCNYPTWDEMTDAERGALICNSCNRNVTTITYPCRHPYFCAECAQIFFKFYHKCPKCKRRIKSYDEVY